MAKLRGSNVQEGSSELVLWASGKPRISHTKTSILNVRLAVTLPDQFVDPPQPLLRISMNFKLVVPWRIEFVRIPKDSKVLWLLSA